jgi:hypothetical protein
MTHTPRRRDRLRLGISTVTALVGAGSLTAVGWFAGTAARQHDTEQARADADHAAAVAKAAAARARYDRALAERRTASFPHRVVLRPRPTRTVVRTQYVQSAAAPVTVGGGTLSSPSGSPPPTPPHSAPAPHAPPPPPPPPPPPAPSSGS